MAGYLPQNRGNKSANRSGASTSRWLRARGWNISPAARKHKADGIFVSGRGDWVSILFDTGVRSRNIEAAKGMVRDLEGWSRASRVRMSDAGELVTVVFDYTSDK